MRASRLLQMLLLLQNRGRMSCAALARELEVARRTVLRDVDALTEAGLPIVAIRGNQGGVELGFNYRTRLTGLAADEAEALAVILSQPCPALDDLAMRRSGNRAVAKLLESFPDAVRRHVETARARFTFPNERNDPQTDERIAAFAEAIRHRNIVIVHQPGRGANSLHPIRMAHDRTGWTIHDARPSVLSVKLKDCGNINISARRF